MTQMRVWVARVAESQRGHSVASARQDSLTDFDFTERRSDASLTTAARRAEYYPIFFAVPTSGNEDLLGFDLAANPTSRAFLEQTAASGTLTASAAMTGNQAQRAQDVFFIARPVYQHGLVPQNGAQRSTQLKGFVLALLRIDHLVENGEKQAASRLELRLFDDTPAAGGRLLYPKQAGSEAPTALGPNLTLSRTLNVAGRSWRVIARPKAASFGTDREKSSQMLALGLLIALLAARHLRRRQRQYEIVSDLVDKRTHELDRERARLRTILETASDGIHIVDANGLLIDANPAFLNLLGYDQSAVGKRRITDWDTQDPQDVVQRRNQALLDGNGSASYETRHRRLDGLLIEVEVDARAMRIDGQRVLYCAARDITLRKRNEALLRERDRDLRTIIDNLPAMVSYWDKNLRNRFGNHAYSDWVGIEPAQMRGMHIREVIGQQSYQASQPYLEAALRGEAQQFEQPVVMPDGKQVRHSLSHFIPDLVDGQVAGFYALISDISSIRQADAALHENEEKLRRLYDLSSLGIAMTDMQGHFVDFNQAFQRISGFSAPELTLLNYQSLTPDQYLASDAAQLETLMHSGQFGPYEKEYLRQDGSLVPVSINGVLITGSDAEKYIWFILEDISGRKQKEQQLIEAEALLRTAIETIGEAFVIYDAQDQLVYCNQQYRDVYSTSAPVLEPGRSFEEIIRYGVAHGQYPAAIGCEEEWIAGRLTNHRLSNQEWTQQLDNGRWLKVRERRTKSGLTIEFRIDITEFQAAKQAAEAASNAKSRFLATMGHEIRTPMNGILGMAQVLLMPGVQEADRLDYARTIYNTGQTLLTLLNDILDLSKIEAGKVELESITFSPIQLIGETRKLYAPIVAAKGLQIETDHRAHAGPGHGRRGGRRKQCRSRRTLLVSHQGAAARSRHLASAGNGAG